MELWQRVVYVCIGFFESLTFSGLIFGWPSLVLVLQREGVYSHLCGVGLTNVTQEVFETSDLEISTTWASVSDSGQNVTDLVADVVIRCKEQDKIFGLLYSIMLVVFGVPSAAVGFSLDYLGLRYTRLYANTMVTGGFVFLAFATSATPWTIWPGMLMICLGANTLRLCALQYANAWPAKRSTIMFLYTSAHAFSTTVFLMFQYANAYGIPLKASAFTVGVICACTFISTFILPKMKVEDQVSKKISVEMEPMTNNNETEGQKCDSKPNEVEQFLRKSSLTESTLAMAKKKAGEVESAPIPLMKSMATVSFWLHMVWLLNVYMLRFYTTSFNMWAWKTTNDQSQVAFYNTISGICSLVSPFISPFGGMATDYLIQRASNQKDPVERLASKFQAPALILGISGLLLLGVYACKLFYSPTAVYLSIVLVSIARPVTIGSVYAYVRVRFYPEHFNRLTGMGFTIISAICLLQYPMLLWLFMSDASYTVASLFCCIVIAVTFTSPGHLLVRKFVVKFAAAEILYRKDA